MFIASYSIFGSVCDTQHIWQRVSETGSNIRKFLDNPSGFTKLLQVNALKYPPGISLVLTVATVCSFETSVNSPATVHCHNLEYHSMNTYRRKNVTENSRSSYCFR